MAAGEGNQKQLSLFASLALLRHVDHGIAVGLWQWSPIPGTVLVDHPAAEPCVGSILRAKGVFLKLNQSM